MRVPTIICFQAKPNIRILGMIKVHHLENSRSQRILWLLEELALQYEIVSYKRDPVTMLAPDSLAAVHPLGKSPLIVDGEITVAESGAIIEYLVDRFGSGKGLRPEGREARVSYTYWLHYAEGSLMPLLLMKLVFDRLAKPPMPLPMRPVAALIASGVKAKFVNPRLTQHLDFVEGELARHKWFAGTEFSAADIQMSFPLEAAATRADAGADRPRISAFLERIHARPAFKKALKRGGPYAYAD